MNDLKILLAIIFLIVGSAVIWVHGNWQACLGLAIVMGAVRLHDSTMSKEGEVYDTK